MYEIMTFDEPTRVIAHFKQDEELAAKHGTRLVRYQVQINTDKEHLSPCGEFMRFNFCAEDGEPVNEVNGWIKIDDIVIDTVLETYQRDRWLRASNG